MQVSTLTRADGWSGVQRVVTSTKGSWRWQDAFRISLYEPRARKNGKGFVWVSVATGNKFPRIARTTSYWTEYGCGSLHHKPARAVVDDFGNLVFVVDAG